MIAFIRKLLKDRRGNALAIACAAMPLVVGASGLAVDTIQWTLWKRQLQRAADSAAIAGVYDRSAASGGTATVMATVNHDLDLNKHTWMALKSGYPQLEYPANNGVTTNQVKVTLAVSEPLPFSSFFMSTAPTIYAVSTAATISAGGSACVQSLDPRAVTGITNNGNTNIDMPNCIMYSNSSSVNSASAGGSSNVKALAIAAVGGIQQSNNWIVGAYRPYSPPLADPFANLNPAPSEMNCVNQPLTDQTNFSTLPAGTNCFSSLSVGSNRTLNIPANFGPIFLNGGSANLQGSFNCTGCAIVLTNKTAASPIGTISSNAQATNNISAPTDGKYKGIAIMQDRRAQDCSSCNKINGGSSSVITGAMYFPSQELWYNGGATPSIVSTCTMVVARRIVFTGNSKFKALGECSGEGLPQATSVTMVRLIS